MFVKWVDRIAERDAWWRYLVLADYSLRERLGYTASEALYLVALKVRRLFYAVESWGDKAQKWGSA